VVQGFDDKTLAFLLSEDCFQGELDILALIDILKEHGQQLVVLVNTLKHVVESLHNIDVAFFKGFIKVHELGAFLEHQVVLVLLLDVLKVPHDV